MTSWRSRAIDPSLSTAGAVTTRNGRQMAHQGDTYASCTELAQCETDGKDYAIQARTGTSSVAIIAPHGGGIETGTATLADAVAGDRHGFYAFKGIKPSGNAVLHITSHRFDEPTGVRIVAQADVAVALHGHHDRRRPVVYIGGRNQALKQKIETALTRSGFRAEITNRSDLQARNPQNLCNRCRSGQGVQLEISRALREEMFDRLYRRSRRRRTPLFHRFVETLRACLP